jgi:hypothetical protein
MSDAVLAEVLRYWLALRRRRFAPERHELSPCELASRNAITSTFILERDEELLLRIRVSASRLNLLWCAELRGRNAHAAWKGQEQQFEIALHDTSECGQPTIVLVNATRESQPPLPVKFLFLPLLCNGQRHVRLLGCVSYRAVPGWLGLLPPDQFRDAESTIVRLNGNNEVSPHPELFCAAPARLRVIHGGKFRPENA